MTLSALQMACSVLAQSMCQLQQQQWCREQPYSAFLSARVYTSAVASHSLYDCFFFPRGNAPAWNACHTTVQCLCMSHLFV